MHGMHGHLGAGIVDPGIAPVRRAAVLDALREASDGGSAAGPGARVPNRPFEPTPAAGGSRLGHRKTRGL